jgi:signal transduction histidine kinase
MYERMPFDRRDALDPPLDQGQTILVSNVHSDPRMNEHLRRLQEATGRPALAFIPLIVRRRRIGVVVLSYPTVYEWNESDLWPYQVTAAQLATAIDTRWQQLLLVRSSQEVAVLHDRHRLARELHDSVTQLIFSMTLVAQSVAPAWRRDEEEGKQRIDRLIELSQGALAEMRGLLFELRSPEASILPDSFGLTLPGITKLKRDGLVSTLSNHVKSLKIEKPVVSLVAERYEAQALETEIALFRIAQEGLNNVLKHSDAVSVSIRLAAEESAVFLKVQDDGCGFDNSVQTEQSSTGFGLRSMEERTEALNGRFKINSIPGQGTTVTVSIPIVR